MMENNNDWFGNLNYSSIDPQQQTYVTKHDLELLHKKIIATDLIVQKYQDANKALFRLQIENDDLKQQIEQITNECCIFGKQVTECTQECDNLKEQIEVLNSEKREFHQELRLLQDENTNNHHEIMVLRQFESLKEINDQLTKTVDRQQKTIAKLQLQVQRKSPIVYKLNKNKQEPSETDIALTKSQKSVRELKLALGRLVNFIQSSQIEIPTALHIKPVLKAHEINDDFLEITGDFIPKPVTKVIEPVVSQIVDDDDDDDDHGDFIDVNHSIQPPPVNTTTTTSSINIIEETPVPSKSTSRQQQKKKEIPKTKTKTKTRRQKDVSISESPSAKIDDLANELEMALSQSNQQHIQQLPSFLSDDDDEDKAQKSDKQQLPKSIYPPSIQQSATTYPERNSTKSIAKDISFFSDDDNDEILQQKLALPSSPIYTPIIDQQPISTPSVNEQTISSLQVDSIIRMEIEIPDKPTNCMSFLSEDDELTPSVSTSIIERQSFSQEYIFPLELNKPSLNKDSDDNHKSQSSDKYSSLSSMEDSPSNKQTKTISENIQDSLLNEKDQTITSSVPINTLDSNGIKIVLRLLHILTQAPVPLKPLRLVRRHIQQKKILKEQVILSTGNKSDDKTTHIEIPEHLTPKQANITEENNITFDDISENQVSLQTEEQEKPTEEIHIIINEISEDRVSESIDEQLMPNEELHSTIKDISENEVSLQMEEQVKSIEENHDIGENDTISSELHEELGHSVEENPLNENIAIIKEFSSIPTPQESTPTVETIPGEQVFSSKNEPKQPLPPLLLEIPKQSLLKPFQISIISRLLNTLINLPVKPLILPMPFPLQKRKRKAADKKPSVTLPPQTSNRISRLPNQMQTRSLTSIRACIARCNQPAVVTRKRTRTELISSSSPPPPPPVSKRIKKNINEYDLVEKFIISFSKEINDELRKILEQKLHEDILLFSTDIHRILMELMINKCDVILPLVKQLHPYEESIKILLVYINSKSTIFQQHFITKLNQTFEYEIKQQQIFNNRIKILNRLLFLSCSIFASSSSSVIIYARLFDIGYYLSHDVLSDALSFISNTCSSLISIDSQTKSSNVLFHQILFDILQAKKLNISLEYLENLLVAYHRYTHDQEDLIRSFILISRYQSWLWCSNELCSKFLFPLFNKIDDQYSQRIIILIILQFVLIIYKNNEDFKQDIIFHDQIKQLLLSSKTMNSDERTVRDKILSVLHSFC